MDNTGNSLKNLTSNNPVNEFMNSPAYPGSWQQVLTDNMGEYCRIDFLIGVQNMVQKEGILYNVGVSFVILFDPRTEEYCVCDLYSIKFVTFNSSRTLPSGKSLKKRV